MGDITNYFNVKFHPTNLERSPHALPGVDKVVFETPTERTAVLRCNCTFNSNSQFEYMVLDTHKSSIPNSILTNTDGMQEIFTKIIRMLTDSVVVRRFNRYSKLQLVEDTERPTDQEKRYKMVLTINNDVKDPLVLFFFSQLHNMEFSATCTPKAYNLLDRIYKPNDMPAREDPQEPVCDDEANFNNFQLKNPEDTPGILDLDPNNIPSTSRGRIRENDDDDEEDDDDIGSNADSEEDVDMGGGGAAGNNSKGKFGKDWKLADSGSTTGSITRRINDVYLSSNSRKAN